VQITLPNGLDVILQVEKAAPVVALQAWVQVGSADESDREAGLAHLHEHMLFKGTRKRGPGQVAKDIESRGGSVNAWTSFDQTVYHLTIASQYFEDGLEILGDQVLASIFDPDELAREIEVVLEEIKRANDMPARRASRSLFDLVYSKHPYGRPVIGFPETVRGFTRADVLGFYERYYTPDNITLVVVGDFDETRALAAIEGIWGGAQGRHGGFHPRTAEPEQRAARVRITREPVQETHLSLAWPIPGIHAEELAVLDLAAAVLGHGDSSRLNQEVKQDRRLCNQIYAYAYTPKDPGIFTIGATLRHEQIVDATREILQQIARLRTERVQERELEVTKHLLESEAIWQRETVQGVARKLGFYATVTGSLEFEARYFERLRSVTAEELRDTCDRFLRGERLNVVALAEEASAAEEAEIAGLALASEPGTSARKRKRKAATAAVPGDAGVYRKVLSSGATVLVRPEASVPVVAARAAFLGGLRYEDPQNNGIHHLLARTLTKGTRRLSAKEVASRTDQLAASFTGSSGRNSFGLRGDFLAKNFEPSLRLFAECLLQPSFDGKEVERERTLQLEEIRARDDNPSSVAFDLFAEALYLSHPYRLDPLGTAETLSEVSTDALERWHRSFYGPDRLVLSLVGAIDPEEGFALAEELFGEALQGQRAPPLVRAEPAPTEARRALRHMEKEQAHLLLGFLGARFQDPERYPLEVLASVLAGQGGRLFYELRDKRSMAYSVTAFSMEGVDNGYFGVYIGTSPEKLEAAEAGIREELAKVVATEITEEELQRARRYLIGSHAIGLQRNASRAASIALDEVYGLGAANFARYAANIEAVGRAQVLEAARRFIDLDRSVVAVVTPEAT